jgi:branched-subunit amino acid aminotransferase/4-amino-4-deoxychorismate lyase
VKLSARPVGSTAPVSLALATVVHRSYTHKTTDRAQFDRALEEARAAGADDAIMLTAGGWVAECAVWGLFWWEGGRLCAPALELGVLPGVARARLEEMAGGLVERRVRLGDLEGRSLFVANAARGVVPVATLEGRKVPQDPGTARVSGTFWP